MMSRGYDKSVGARGSDISVGAGDIETPVGSDAYAGARGSDAKSPNRAGKYSGFLLCSDWDGTLTANGRTVSEANLSAIEHFESEGGIFTIASGRYPSYLGNMQIKLSSYALLLNGNLIYDPKTGEVLWEQRLEAPVIKSVIKTAYDGDFGWNELHVYTLSDRISFARADCINPEVVLERIGASPVYKMILMLDPAIDPDFGRWLESNVGGISCQRSWPAGLEVNPVSGGKGNGVLALRNLLGGRDKIHTIVCVGDYENDIPMLRRADIGYAVANALDSVKAAADRVTVANTDDAIAHIISELNP